MGSSYGNFVKFPRTPHLFGSTGTGDDLHLSERQSVEFLTNDSLFVEEKIDGTNVGIHFTEDGELILQCRGHLLTEGAHQQFDPFKAWAMTKQHIIAEVLQNQHILFGEWVYARHTIHYHSLPHYFLAFDVFDKSIQRFLGHDRRTEFFREAAVHTVPILHVGPIRREGLDELIGKSQFSEGLGDSQTNLPSTTMEGIYLRIESGGYVIGRAKYVTREFAVKMKENSAWRHQKMTMNSLAQDADVWS